MSDLLIHALGKVEALAKEQTGSSRDWDSLKLRADEWD